jgi:gluconate 2-dehydrogenase gamma chain
MQPLISRRELLRRASLAGAVAIVPGGGALLSEASAPSAALQTAASREPYEHLTALEADVLEAMVARIIPGDANGPGAREARAARYIDRALGGALASSRPAYGVGLAALDRFSQSARGRAFTSLPPAEQYAVLSDVETGNVPGFADAPAFFALVRAHTLQGTFCDPYYGGNAGFVGWDLIGYPGVRTFVAADEQRLGADVPANHKSAYDYDMFTKAGTGTMPVER